MVERLITALRALAGSADPSAGTLTGSPERARDTARDFADAHLLVADCPQLELSATQRSALARVAALVDAMPDPADPPNDAPATGRAGSAEWERLRAAAADALAILNAADPTPP